VLAATCESPAIARLLVSRGARAPSSTDAAAAAALHTAVSRGPVECLEALLDAGVSVNAAHSSSSSSSSTALYTAAAEGDCRALELLLQHGPVL
jgi:ankyrin repeat protein